MSTQPLSYMVWRRYSKMMVTATSTRISLPRETLDWPADPSAHRSVPGLLGCVRGVFPLGLEIIPHARHDGLSITVNTSRPAGLYRHRRARAGHAGRGSRGHVRLPAQPHRLPAPLGYVFPVQYTEVHGYPELMSQTV